MLLVNAPPLHGSGKAAVVTVVAGPRPVHVCVLPALVGRQVVEAAKEWMDSNLPPDVGSKRDMAHAATAAGALDPSDTPMATAHGGAGADTDALLLPSEAAMAHVQKGTVTSDGDEGTCAVRVRVEACARSRPAAHTFIYGGAHELHSTQPAM